MIPGNVWRLAADQKRTSGQSKVSPPINWPTLKRLYARVTPKLQSPRITAPSEAWPDTSSPLGFALRSGLLERQMDELVKLLSVGSVAQKLCQLLLRKSDQLCDALDVIHYGLAVFGIDPRHFEQEVLRTRVVFVPFGEGLRIGRDGQSCRRVRLRPALFQFLKQLGRGVRRGAP